MTTLYLVLAIVTEVIGTVCMKLSEGFTKVVPSVVVVLGYGLSLYFLTLALKRIPVSVAYAVWSAVGTALIALLGVWLFKETLSPVKIFSLLLIIAGVVGLNLDGRDH